MISTHTIPGESVALACAPVHKRALGVAVGLVSGLCVFGLTAFHIALRPTAEGINIALLAQYFYGFEISWTGSVIGLGWGFATGFIVGWFLAFVRNLVVTTAAFALMTQKQLAQTRRFLDHI